MNFVVVDNNKSDLDLLADAITAAMPKCQVERFTDPLLSAVAGSAQKYPKADGGHAVKQ